MVTRIHHKVIGSILWLMFLLAAPGPAFAGAPSPPHPDRPNVVWDVSAQKTVIVHLLNATPYNMVLKSSPFSNSNYQQEVQGQYDEGAIMFTPSGIPQTVPKNSGRSFVVTMLDNGSNASDVAGEYDMLYTLQQVDASSVFQPGACTINPVKADVDVHLEFDHVKESKSLKGDIFDTVVEGLKVIVEGGEIVASGGEEGWFHFLESSAALAEDIATTINDANESSDQGYFNAFVVSYNNQLDTSLPGITTSATDSDTAAQYAGISTQQPYSHGCPQSIIEVPVVILREKGPNSKELNGNLPVILAAVVTQSDQTGAQVCLAKVSPESSRAGNKIMNLLKSEGLNGRKAVLKLFRTLDYQEISQLRETYKAIAGHKRLTEKQEDLLEQVAVALEKHQSYLHSPVQAGQKKSINERGVRK
ncbi:MAG TPA: hypothetical protein VN611_04365 [Patescibacteria group bacterium]|nr:hypothetical protein [Patescibacteria group bacterium]